MVSLLKTRVTLISKNRNNLCGSYCTDSYSAASLFILKKKLSTNSSRDFNSVLDIINHLLQI